MNLAQVVDKIKSLSDQKNAEGMARFGITSKSKIYGVSMPDLRKLAKEIGEDHELALQLWAIDSIESRLVASIIANPEKFTEKDADSWIKNFDNWALCDQCCLNLFWKLPFAYEKAREWTSRKEEFEKRAGFALLAVLAWKDKQAKNSKLEEFIPLLEQHACDERLMVKKSVNWALRQIGKRNPALNKKAIASAKRIKKQGTPSAKWIAGDALRELKSEAVQKRLAN